MLRLMTERTTIAAAGNTMAPALAVLREIGFTVTKQLSAEGLYEAVGKGCTLVAEDPLTLLGLAKLYEVRGAGWRPTDAEVSEFLEIDNDGEA